MEHQCPKNPKPEKRRIKYHQHADPSNKFEMLISDGRYQATSWVSFCPWCGVDLSDWKRATDIVERENKKKKKG